MMVRALHAAGIEVILDVVYNHTAEGNQLGPTLSMRGVDNASYYRLSPEDPRYYMDFTGCGNTLNMQHPRVLQLIMDSLRYWVLEMHVDGFRFDLASTLARELFEVNKLGAFFDIIHQDPVLSQVKLIAEPWDVGEGGYQVGNFPVLWTEWNGKYRDSVRRFWKGDGGTVVRVRHAPGRQQRPVRAERPAALRQHQLHHLPRRLHAARPGQLQRQAQRGQRRGQQGRRQRQQQLELRRRRADRRPGHQRPARAAEAQPDRHAVAVAGRADDLRRRRAEPHAEGQQQRLLPGQRADLAELGAERRADRSSWSSSSRWRASGTEQPVFQRRKFFQGRSIRGSDIKDISWFEPRGKEMSDEAWDAGFVQVPGRAPGRRPDRRRGRARRADRRRHAAAAAQRPPRSRFRSRCRRPSRSITGNGCWTRPDPSEAPAVCRRAEPCTRCRGGRWSCCARARPEEAGQAISATQVETLLKATHRLPQPARILTEAIEPPRRQGRQEEENAFLSCCCLLGVLGVLAVR